MNKQASHIYTAEDIKKYLEGKLTPTQMYAIEKDALNDPFLSEAIEGYEENKEADWQKYLTEAKHAFAQKQNTAKVVPLNNSKKTLWRIAATVVIVSGLAVAYNLINKKIEQQPTEVAVTTNEEAKATAPVNTVTPSTTTTATPVNTDEAVVQNKTTERVKPKTIALPTSNNPLPAGGREGMVRQVLDGSKDKKTDPRDEIASTSPAPIAAKEIAAEAKQEEKFVDANVAKNKAVNKPTATPSTYNFISQVFSTDNTPLPFANVSIEKEDFGTYADVKGNFRLNSTDSFVTVLVKSTGYQPRYYTLNTKATLNKIVLQDATIDPKNEVVIASSSKGKGVVSRKATFLRDTIINVEPKDGWANYSTYISNNIEIPDDVAKDITKGKKEVEVSFEVTSTGAITNIKVDNTNCNGCDAEQVKRAIQQGPQWKPKNGRAGSAKIKVKF
jgi:hypothetical protein